MRAVDFDPDAWLAQSESTQPAIPAKVAILQPASAEKIAGIAGIAAQQLAPELVAGLDRLRMMEPPRITRPALWPEIVFDAVRLSRDGWAERALAVGWEPLQLWGCSPAIGGDIDLEGLAVRLCGRKIIRIEKDFCEVKEGESWIAFLKPFATDGAIYLWDLARAGNDNGA